MRNLLLVLIFFVLFGSLLLWEKRASTVIFENSVQLRVETAETFSEKARGLSGLDEIPRGGLLFVYDTPQEVGIWMKEMRFPIDIIWVADGEVIHMVERAQPDDSPEREVYRADRPVDYVLEIEAGEVERRGIEVGMEVEVEVKRWK